ncbi:TATA box-binding protein-associated factor RNA polymerase I subunit A [Schistosoma japonicum]|nr:TATA box-binding protein-associated factor RNA polymerase I subunit A [Schistosoma japonicum]KAH8865476.1 TATA box-binding protein-associated factor RNA polymerase I subunit A [Schistosoma japonicum]KAH8865478.1 TATA box-binding protein-associated factor RNA polymerase I subunit A [Schistosoma japonicum]KAH8865479.1 TATA box-binding protein-associated factor RNA polymerase I subunit A [Schistosoma japonicum]
MTDHRHSHGRNKLYFLRLRRFCQFILNLARNGFYEGWMGKESYLTLNTAEDFRLLHSEKARIICAMWYLLSRHKFKEAARLLAHSIHKYPISPTWLWRVAFHIFQCHRDDIGLRSFNRVLDAFLLSDENNRILEFILYEISKGNLDTVQFCRTNKQLVQRNKYSINHAVLTREPEFTHVQRLQRLYEGYGFYGMWLKKINSFALAEKLLKLKIKLRGIICTFSLVNIQEPNFILQYFNECTHAHTILLEYARKVPENPNTLRYLCEWHKRRPGQVAHSLACFSPSQSVTNNCCDSSASCSNDLNDGNIGDTKIFQSNISHQNKSSSSMKNSEICLEYRISFSRRTLPEPAPNPPDNYETMSKKEVRNLLRTNHAHLPTIVTCLKRGRFLDALDLSFLLLDHPSWAVYCEPWRLLRKSIFCIGKTNSQVLHAWTIRKVYWNKLQFSLSNLPVIGKSMKSLLNKLDLCKLDQFNNDKSKLKSYSDVQLTIAANMGPVLFHESYHTDLFS